MHNRTSRFFRSLFICLTAACLTALPLSAQAAAPDETPQEATQVLSPLWVQQLLLSSPYQQLPNGRPELESRYTLWAEANPQLTAEQVVLQVNIGLDKDFYEDTRVVSQPDSLTALVNKYYSLPQNYVPQLEDLGYPYGSGSLRPEAAAAFRTMADAAREEGIYLYSVSAYRSYQRQEIIYTRYLTQDSQASVDTYSARPGFSEHQTALALDINAASLSSHFENTPAYAWLVENCAQYGFILRYPQDKEDITGYCFEPWHYRYVGTEVALACMEQGLTLEEYLALQPISKVLLFPQPVEGLPFI